MEVLSGLKEGLVMLKFLTLYLPVILVVGCEKLSYTPEAERLNFAGIKSITKTGLDHCCK